MDKETLSNYGWIVILVLVLAVMLALASPFGNFIAGAIKATTAGLFGVNQSALNAGGITIPGQSFEETDDNITPDSEWIPGLYQTGSNYTVLIKSWDDLIADGAITINDGTLLGVKENFSMLAGDLRIARNVSTIGYSAFNKCNELTGVSIPNTLLVVGQDSFHYAKGIQHVEFEANSSVHTIDYEAFVMTTALEKITIPKSVVTLDGRAFMFSGIKSCDFEEGSLCTSIGNSAFYECKQLQSVYIPKSVKLIDTYAFAWSKAITNITIESGSELETIGDYAFCITSLTEFTVPKSVKTIGYQAFAGVSTLTTLDFEGNSVCTKIGGQAFGSCSALVNLYIPASIQSIDSNAFSGCTFTEFDYGGSESDWQAITIGSYGNDAIKNATIHYNVVK